MVNNWYFVDMFAFSICSKSFQFRKLYVEIITAIQIQPIHLFLIWKSQMPRKTAITESFKDKHPKKNTQTLSFSINLPSNQDIFLTKISVDWGHIFPQYREVELPNNGDSRLVELLVLWCHFYKSILELLQGCLGRPEEGYTFPETQQFWWG